MIPIGEVNIVRVRNPLKWNRPMTWLATAIRKFTGKKFNHEGFAIWDDGKFWMCHAVWPRVKKVDYWEWWWSIPRGPDDVEVEEIETENPDALIAEAFKYIGTPYDLANLLIYSPVYICTGKWIGPTGEKAKRRMTCVEYKATVLHQTNAYRAIPEKRIIETQ